MVKFLNYSLSDDISGPIVFFKAAMLSNMDVRGLRCEDLLYSAPRYSHFWPFVFKCLCGSETPTYQQIHDVMTMMCDPIFGFKGVGLKVDENGVFSLYQLAEDEVED